MYLFFKKFFAVFTSTMGNFGWEATELGLTWENGGKLSAFPPKMRLKSMGDCIMGCDTVACLPTPVQPRQNVPILRKLPQTWRTYIIHLPRFHECIRTVCCVLNLISSCKLKPSPIYTVTGFKNKNRVTRKLSMLSVDSFSPARTHTILGAPLLREIDTLKPVRY